MKKMDKKKEKASFESFMRNPSWKKIYEGSPSEECKDYWRYTFYNSKYYDPDAEDAGDFDDMRDFYYDRLSVEDWEYIKKFSGNSPFVGYIDQRIKKLKGKK